MKSFSGYISEALDKPYPLKWDSRDAEDIKATAITKNKIELNIYFTNQASTGDPPVIDITFMTKQPGRLGFGSMAATGEGDEFRVFATVKNAIERWWAQRDKVYEDTIREIKFQASKHDADDDVKDAKRRNVLYTRLAKHFAKKTGYRLSIQDLKFSFNFKLTYN